MSLVCAVVRERLADGGFASDEREVADHLAGCAECTAIERALREIDLGISSLPAIEPAEALVARTITRARGRGVAEEGAALETVAAHGAIGTPSFLVASLAVLVSAIGALLAAPFALARWMIASSRGRWTFALGGGLAACAALLSTMMYGGAEAPSMGRPLIPGRADEDANEPRVQIDGVQIDGEPEPADWAAASAIEGTRDDGARVASEEQGDGVAITDRAGDESIEEERYQLRVVASERTPAEPIEQAPAFELGLRSGDFETLNRGDQGTVDLSETGALAEGRPQEVGDDGRDLEQATDLEGDVGGALAPRAAAEVASATRSGRTGQRGEERSRPGTTSVQPETSAGATQGITERGLEERAARERESELRAPEHRRGPAGETITTRARGARETIAEQIDAWDDTRERLREEAQQRQAPPGGGLAWRYDAEREHATTITDESGMQAPSRWWSAASSTEGLSFHARDGWWASSYVPGDPSIRALHARLASARDLRLSDRTPLALAETATPIAPAIEAPADRALALGVQGDVAAIEGPTRVRVEVDLRGIQQAAGRRAPMRIAVVLDARSALEPGEQARARALLRSLGRAAGARDRITVLAAGAHGGTLVPLGALRHGELEVALRRLLAGEGGAPSPIDQAIAEGALAVASPDDVGLVILATPDASHDRELDLALHRAAVAGVPTSVVAIGDRARAEDLDAIALAGQGRRRIVRSPAEADAAARAEIEAASQLVARALRVRVRLAPGVRLIDVLGSRPLATEEVARTREAERAIDRDLARRLGIAADRDEDDEGIRIFLPAFYADDAHAIVLDLLVAGPGAIAEVDVRYKDLVLLSNGVASGALSLPRGAPSRGPRELRVISAFLAHEVAEALSEAGDRAQAGDAATARLRLLEARAAIEAARTALPGLARDRSVAALATLCDRYAAALATGSDVAIVAASAHYASYRLLLRPRLAAGD